MGSVPAADFGVLLVNLRKRTAEEERRRQTLRDSVTIILFEETFRQTVMLGKDHH